jgi:adenosylcobinamide-GDP ribazoletransferase
MKDSFVGVYGVVAVGLSLVLRISLLAALVGEVNLILACIGIGAISRAPMVALMFALPNARDEGLSASVGHAPAAQMAVALGLGSVVVVASLFTAGLFVIAMVTITTLLWAMIARAQIGGQTGDILGATQQLSEIAALIGLSIWLA